MTANPVATATISERLVAVLTKAWQAIQANHDAVPDVVLTLGAGSIGQGRGRLRLGHFAANRWQQGEDQIHEFFIGGEGLKRGSLDVLGTLLHEATHGVAFTTGTKDTSRAGKYHNTKFKALAEELGLVVEHDKTIGFSLTTVPPSTAARYRAVLAELDEAITVYRHAEMTGAAKPKSSNYVKAECECGHVIRVGKTTLAAATITCTGEDGCGKPFVSLEIGDEDQD